MFSKVGLTAFVGTETGTATEVDSPASILKIFPFCELSCQPKSEPSSIVKSSELPILDTIQVNVVVAPGSIARSPGVDTSMM